MDFFELAGALWSHSPKMIAVMKEKNIPRPVLTAEETERLIAYIYFLGFFEELGDEARGEKTFSEKGCGRCHSLGGGRKTPLDRYGRYVSPVFIAAELWNHSSSISQAMMAGSFAPGEMSDLLAFIRSEALNPGGDTVYVLPGNSPEGENVFREKKCFVCHGENGVGLRKASLRKGLTEIVGSMWNHSSRMWTEMKGRGLEVPRFAAREMADLMSFLYFLQFYGEEGNPAKGKTVFSEKGCAVCHGPEAVEKKKGPDLKTVSVFSIPELISAMWNHVPEMEKMVTELNLIWPRFEKDEMKDLIYYLRSFDRPRRLP
jgi:cytochrome c